MASSVDELEPMDYSNPVSDSQVRPAYLAHASVGYITYGVGAITTFIAVDLSLSDTQAGLHSSAFAVGVIAAGVAGQRLDRRFGDRTVHIAALMLLGIAVTLFILAPALPLTLTAALVAGVGNGFLFAYISRTLTSGGGSLARVRLARSTLVSTVSAFSASLVIGIGVAIGLGWQVFILPAAVLLTVSFVAARSREQRPVPVTRDHRRLPGAFWLAWVLVTLTVAIEFFFIYWATSVVEGRTGVALKQAAFALPAYVLGIVLIRSGLSFHAVSRLDPVLLLRVGLVAVLVASLVVWASTWFVVSIASLVLAGAGVGILYPLAATVAFTLAPGQAPKASGRIVLGVGLAILTAPFILGVLGDISGIVTAWVLVPLVCLATTALTVPVGHLLRRSSSDRLTSPTRPVQP
jgi:MFS family permease